MLLLAQRCQNSNRAETSAEIDRSNSTETRAETESMTNGETSEEIYRTTESETLASTYDSPPGKVTFNLLTDESSGQFPAFSRQQINPHMVQLVNIETLRAPDNSKTTSCRKHIPPPCEGIPKGRRNDKPSRGETSNECNGKQVSKRRLVDNPNPDSTSIECNGKQVLKRRRVDKPSTDATSSKCSEIPPKRQCIDNTHGKNKQKYSKKTRNGVVSSLGKTFTVIPIDCNQEVQYQAKEKTKQNQNTYSQEQNDVRHCDMLVFLERIRAQLKQILEEELGKRKSFKFYLTVSPELQRISTYNEIQVIQPHLHSRPTIVMHATDLDVVIEEAMDKISQLLECFEVQRSGYTLSKILECNVNVSSYDVIGGSSHIPLPPHIQSKRACVNINNENSNCFQFLLLYVRKPNNSKDSNEAYHYEKHLGELNMDGIKSPVPIKQIPRFEKQNPVFSVDVYGLLGKYKQDRQNKVRLYPMHTSPHKNRKHHANLLLLKNRRKSHYVVIKSLSRLLSGRTDHDGRMHVCQFCLYLFAKKESFTAHEEVCSQIPAQVVVYPDESNKYLKF